MVDIPKKKQSRGELQDLQRRNAFAVRPPVQQLQNQAVNRVVLGVFYILSLIGAGLVMGAIYPIGLIDEVLLIGGFSCMGGCLLASCFIFLKKPRSRHHAVILVIISLLVLVMGTVYYVEQFEQEAHDDTQGPIRY